MPSNNNFDLQKALAAFAQQTIAKNPENKNSPESTALIPVTRNPTRPHSDKSNPATITHATRETITAVIHEEGEELFAIQNHPNGDITLHDHVYGALTIPNDLITPAICNAIHNTETLGKA